jgi:alpha-methylacyl-CoA racemase
LTATPPQSASGPLSGLRMIELAGIGPGPWAAMMFSDMGAEVIRIDRPAPTSSYVPAALDIARRGRKSVALDLRHPEGVATVLRLVGNADVLMEGFRPGVAERLGVGPEPCLQRNPALVYGRMTGWGQDGPLARTAGHDITYLAVTGALHAMGRSGEAPAVPLNLVGDYGGGGAFLVIGVLAALLEAKSSGQGQVVDAAIVDGTLALTASVHGMLAAGLWKDERGVNLLDTGRPWYDVYETADHKHVSVGPLEPPFYEAMMHGVELDPTTADRAVPEEWPQLRDELAEKFVSRTRDDWQERFEHTDACVAPVLSLSEAARHPHLIARESFLDVDGVVQPAPAPRFSRTPSAIQSSPAEPGEHSAVVLREWGFSTSEIDALFDSGAAVQQGG